MRLVLAEMMHETNTFSPIATPLEAFQMGTGRPGPVFGADAALARFEGTNTSLGGLIEVARNAGAEIVIPIAGGAPPSGRVDDDAFETFAGAITRAVADGCDAVLLALHGAMATQSHDDGEGELLRRIRALAPAVPLAVALDFHTNLSRAMVDHASVIAGYRTYPHIDTAETGRRAGQILLRALRGEARPAMRMGRLPLLTHTLRQGHDVQPLKDIMDRAVAAEAQGAVLACSLFGGFPMADIPTSGSARSPSPTAIPRRPMRSSRSSSSGFGSGGRSSSTGSSRSRGRSPRPRRWARGRSCSSTTATTCSRAVPRTSWRRSPRRCARSSRRSRSARSGILRACSG
jgi:microcystin degradation protein MlrC